MNSRHPVPHVLSRDDPCPPRSTPVPVQLPDPVQIATQEAARIAANRSYALESYLDRTLSDAPYVDKDSLLEGLDQFHRERMAKIPSASKYPEAKVWVDHILAVDAELKRRAKLTDLQVAILRSLGAY